MTTSLHFAVLTLATALAAYGGNRFFYSRMGRNAALFAVPWCEESCKALGALLLPGLPLLALHLAFGLLESTYDLIRLGRKGWLLGLSSLAAHGLFGVVATVASTQFGGVAWGYLAAGVAHCWLNTFFLPVLISDIDYVAHPNYEEL